MQPENLKFGGGIAETQLHAPFLLLTLAALVAIFLLRKKYGAAGLVVVSFLAPFGEQLYIGGLHLPILRTVILIGLVKVLVSRRGQWTAFDTLFVLWVGVRAMAFILLFMQVGAVVNQVALFLDYVGGFLLLRCLVEGKEEIIYSIRALCITGVILAACMVNEKVNQVNVFWRLRGYSTPPAVRDGKIRAQGSFAHPLLAGTFGATMLPLCGWLWMERRHRLTAVAGAAGATLVAITSASSTPMLAYGAFVLGVSLWPMRNHLRALRWAVGGIVLILAVFMKAPVWFLIARVDLVGGSSGYHRAMLIDMFIRHFGDWWLIGTNDNGNWGWDMWDTCNQFVTEGFSGGLAGLVLFIAILVVAFRRVARARRAAVVDQAKEWQFWLLGVALFSHVVAFFGIVYFDSTRMSWFLLLAIIAVVTSKDQTPALAPVQAVAEETEPREVTVPQEDDWFINRLERTPLGRG